MRLALRHVLLLSVAAVSVAAAPVTPVDTLAIGGVTYLDLNDVLRAVGGAKRLPSEIEPGRLLVGEQELAFLPDSPLVRGPTTSWVLPNPIVSRNGAVWVPREMPERVLVAVTGTGIVYERGLLFVDAEPGRIESVTVRRVGQGCEVALSGHFPVSPSLELASRRITITLDGCRGAVGDVPEGPEALLSAVRVVERGTGAVVELELGADADGYAWREQSTSELRLLVGRSASGLTPLDARPATSPRDIGRVVLDPGHGGSDFGAMLASGIREKWVTLELARIVADALLQAGYEVYLTRDEDRSLTPEDRAALANETGADLMISLEFDTYAVSRAPDVQCAIHRDVSAPERPGSAAGIELVPWSDAHRKHEAESEKLARWILRAAPRSGGDGASGPVGLPLRLLQGVDMPAVQIILSASVTEPDIWRQWRYAFAEIVVDAVRGYDGRRRWW